MNDTAATYSLLSAAAVRERAHRMLAAGLDGNLANFAIDLGKLDATAEMVLATTRAAYPSLDVPFHSRWRHFVIGGVDRFARLAAAARWPDKAARARAAFDLAIISVFLDAGAGPDWRYRDAVTGQAIGRSEGLALASLDMFARGAFSARADDPLRVDAEVLAGLTAQALSDGFQVSNTNPLVGLDGRAALLRALGQLARGNPAVFAGQDSARPGGLYDHFAAMTGTGALAAPAILSSLLRELGPVWPSRLSLANVSLGDCWRHAAITAPDATDGLMPLHKLSQWLAYSLIEPLQDAGIVVADIDGLTGLAEYRNGGLFVDTGVLTLRDPRQAEIAHDVGSELVVEWRALTVALLDRLAASLRIKLGMDATRLPLAKILEGGTWATGRAIARSRRPDASPPIKVVSDGTVF